ncbi:calcium-binding protein [Pseudophaeobacter sp.]
MQQVVDLGFVPFYASWDQRPDAPLVDLEEGQIYQVKLDLAEVMEARGLLDEVGTPGTLDWRKPSLDAFSFLALSENDFEIEFSYGFNRLDHFFSDVGLVSFDGTVVTLLFEALDNFEFDLRGSRDVDDGTGFYLDVSLSVDIKVDRLVQGYDEDGIPYLGQVSFRDSEYVQFGVLFDLEGNETLFNDHLKDAIGYQSAVLRAANLQTALSDRVDEKMAGLRSLIADLDTQISAQELEIASSVGSLAVDFILGKVLGALGTLDIIAEVSFGAVFSALDLALAADDPERAAATAALGNEMLQVKSALEEEFQGMELPGYIKMLNDVLLLADILALVQEIGELVDLATDQDRLLREFDRLDAQRNADIDADALDVSINFFKNLNFRLEDAYEKDNGSWRVPETTLMYFEEVRDEFRLCYLGSREAELVDFRREFFDTIIRLFHGDDSFLGGIGEDRIWAGRGRDVVRASAGDDEVYLEGGRDIAFGGKGHDGLSGGKGHDVLRGNDGSDRLLGEEGDDRLFGGNGKDFLLGGEGDDVLHGGKGRDELFGGSGADTFQFRKSDLGKSGTSRDFVQFFDQEDTFDFTRLNTELGQLRVKYDLANGNQARIKLDIDNDGEFDFTIDVEYVAGGQFAASAFLF